MWRFVPAAGLLIVPLALRGPSMQAATVQHGTADCTGVTGSITFTPPLTTSGSAQEKIAGSFKFSHCTAHGGTDPIRAVANLRATVQSGCPGIVPPLGYLGYTLSATIWWGIRSIAPSHVAFVGIDSSNGSNISLVVGGPNTSATGSYSGADGGATSMASIATKTTVAQATQACSSARGLSHLAIASGTVHIG